MALDRFRGPHPENVKDGRHHVYGVVVLMPQLAPARRGSGRGRGLATKHGYVTGDTPSDALLEDLARHYSFTVYHLTSTCRMGSVVDPHLRVIGVADLRVADASVMPNVTSGNTNSASIMIGEKAAEMIAADHGVHLKEFAGRPR